jgi:hypothetical protein
LARVEFALPAEIGTIAYQNKAVIYGLLFKAATEPRVEVLGSLKVEP